MIPYESGDHVPQRHEEHGSVAVVRAVVHHVEVVPARADAVELRDLDAALGVDALDHFVRQAVASVQVVVFGRVVRIRQTTQVSRLLIARV